MASTGDLIARLRNSRALKIPVGEMIFSARRPTDLEVGALGAEGSRVGELAKRFVTGWENVRVCDICPDIEPKDTAVLSFERELWEEWAVDRLDILTPIGERIMQAYLAHAGQAQGDEKN